MKKLTDNQVLVINVLRWKGADFTAASAQKAWEKGEAFEFDARNGARKGLVRLVKRCNEEAIKNNI